MPASAPPGLALVTLWGLCRVVVKGAPETIEQLLSDVPEGYEDTHRALTFAGARVLALAYRRMESGENFQSMKRSEAEQGLTFAGFLVADTPVKVDTQKVLEELVESNHCCVMITGD
ncbi:PDR2, partial [Symbiodinium sp. KB8]